MAANTSIQSAMPKQGARCFNWVSLEGGRDPGTLAHLSFSFFGAIAGSWIKSEAAGQGLVLLWMLAQQAAGLPICHNFGSVDPLPYEAVSVTNTDNLCIGLVSTRYAKDTISRILRLIAVFNSCIPYLINSLI